MEEKRGRGSRHGDGFALLPFGQTARIGAMTEWPDVTLSVLTVLISFENQKTREAYPGMDTIAALAGISKTSVGPAIRNLQKAGWLKPMRRRPMRGRAHWVYRMLYRRYEKGPGSGSEWISIYHDVIRSGVWAVMPPSARKLYLVMKAFAGEGAYADAGGISGHNGLSSDLKAGFARDFDFIPVSVLDGFGRERPTLANLCGIADRTFRDARAWLTDNGLMRFYEGESYSGLAFPYKPNRYAPKILELLENIKKTRSETARRGCTGHAQKALRALKMRSKKAGRQSGDPRLREANTAVL